MTRINMIAKAFAAATALTLSACGGGHSHSHSTVEVNGITVEPGFVRTPSVDAPATAGYLTISAAQDDKLIAASTPMAGTIEMHTMAMVDGVMRMRPINDLKIPAGDTVELAPGGFHLMIMQPSNELVSAETVDLKLTFQNAGDITVTMPVRRSEDDHGHSHH